MADFDSDRETKLETEASNFAKSGILSQLDPGSKRWDPVAFYSKEMSLVECNYDVHDKVLGTIVSCFKEWSHMLRSCKEVVTFYTDHQNLTYFGTKKVLKPRQVRWASNLTEFDFQVVYTLGHLNTKADILSCCWDQAFGEGGKGIPAEETRLFKPGQLVMSFAKIGINTFWARSVRACRLVPGLLQELRDTSDKDDA